MPKRIGSNVTTRKGGAPGYPRRERIEQQNEVLRQWMAKTPIKQIAQNLRIGIGTVYTRLDAALDAMRPHAEYDEYRKVQLAELEVSRMALRQMIAAWTPGAKGYKSCLEAIDRLLKLQEREARLLGLDKVPTPGDRLDDMTPAQLADLVAHFAPQMAADAEAHANKAGA